VDLCSPFAYNVKIARTEHTQNGQTVAPVSLLLPSQSFIQKFPVIIDNAAAQIGQNKQQLLSFCLAK